MSEEHNDDQLNDKAEQFLTIGASTLLALNFIKWFKQRRSRYQNDDVAPSSADTLGEECQVLLFRLDRVARSINGFTDENMSIMAMSVMIQAEQIRSSIKWIASELLYFHVEDIQPYINELDDILKSWTELIDPDASITDEKINKLIPITENAIRKLIMDLNHLRPGTDAI